MIRKITQDYINEFPAGYFDSEEYKLQIRLNKLVRTPAFKSYLMQFVKHIPRDLNISVFMKNGKMNYCVEIIHYGYEDTYNNGINDYCDLSDFWVDEFDPEIPEELKNAVVGYLQEFEPEIWEIIK